MYQDQRLTAQILSRARTGGFKATKKLKKKYYVKMPWKKLHRDIR